MFISHVAYALRNCTVGSIRAAKDHGTTLHKIR